MGADVTISPGEFSPGNFDRDHRRLRAGAEAEYVYSRMYAEMQLPVSCRLTFVSRITGQISEAPILPVEQLGFGGFDSIRGYDMRDINADSGYILNLELRTVSQPLGLKCDDQIQYLVFYDRGDALSRTVFDFEDGSESLSSVGVGFRYVMGRNVSVRFDYGYQLDDANIGLPQRYNSRLHLGVVISPSFGG